MNHNSITLLLSCILISCSSQVITTSLKTPLFAIYEVRECTNLDKYDLVVGLQEEKICASGNPLLEIQSVDSAWTEYDRNFGSFMVKLKLTIEGQIKFERLTLQYLNKRIGMVLRGTLRSAPTIRGKIKNGVLFVDGLDKDEADSIAVEINSVTKSF